MRRSSTTAWERPLTPSFCMAFEIWFRTVFSLMNSSFAISFVVLSWTNSSNTSFSLFVSNGLWLYLSSFNYCNPPCLCQLKTAGMGILVVRISYERLRMGVHHKGAYEWKNAENVRWHRKTKSKVNPRHQHITEGKICFQQLDGIWSWEVINSTTLLNFWWKRF